MSEDVVYTSRVKVERVQGPVRRAWLPQVDEPVWFGVHSEIAAHYRMDPELQPPHAATIDYVVAATGG